MHRQNANEDWPSIIARACDGDNDAGRYLFACAMRFIRQADPLPEPLAVYMADIMGAALESPTKAIPKALNLSRPASRPKGSDTWSQQIAAAYIAANFDPEALRDLVPPDCDEKTIKRWLDSDLRRAIDMFYPED